MNVSAILLAATFISGVNPELHTFNGEGECGTGAVVPWAGRLWVVSYAPHMPNGSTDKLYEIKPDLTRVIRAESIGGTPANRLRNRKIPENICFRRFRLFRIRKCGESGPLFTIPCS